MPSLKRPRVRRRRRGISRGAGGVNRSPFEIFYDQSLPLAEKKRLLNEVLKRPRSEEEQQDARDYLMSIARIEDEQELRREEREARA